MKILGANLKWRLALQLRFHCEFEFGSGFIHFVLNLMRTNDEP